MTSGRTSAFHLVFALGLSAASGLAVAQESETLRIDSIESREMDEASTARRVHGLLSLYAPRFGDCALDVKFIPASEPRYEGVSISVSKKDSIVFQHIYNSAELALKTTTGLLSGRSTRTIDV